MDLDVTADALTRRRLDDFLLPSPWDFEGERPLLS